MFKSYSQNFEDVILHRLFEDVSDGAYIDIGANDPIFDSVSYAFYQLGWRGIHVEPLPSMANRLRELRPDEEVVEAVVGLSGDSVLFYNISETGMSTGDPESASRCIRDGHSVSAMLVESISLSALMEKFQERPLHWLKIDVEGMEQDVIDSWLPSPVRPWVVLVESTKPNSQEPTFGDWEPQLLALGYVFGYFDGLNRYYVSNDHLELLEKLGPGPNYFDRFSLTRFSVFTQEIAGEIVNLESQIEHLNSDSARLTTALQEAEAAQENQSSQAQVELKALQQYITSLEGGRHAASENAASMAQELEGLNSEIDLLRLQITENITRVEELELTIAELSEKYLALTYEFDLKSSEINDLNGYVALQASELSSASAVLDAERLISGELEGLHRSLKADLERIGAERDQQALDAANLAGELSSANALLNAEKLISGELEGLNRSLKADLERIGAERDQRALDAAKLAGELDAANSRFSDFAAETVSLEAASVELRARLAEVTSLYEAASAQLHVLNANLGMLQEALDASRVEARAAYSTSGLLLKRVGIITNELVAATLERDDLRALVKARAEASEKFEAAAASAFSELGGARLEAERWRTRVEAAEASISKLRATRSWRLTAPIRRCGGLSREISSTLSMLFYRLFVTRPRKLARKSAAAFVEMLKPNARASVGALSRPFRVLRKRLRLAMQVSAPPVFSGGVSPPRSGPASSARVKEEAGAIVYVYVDHTVVCATNTGVQRVVRGISDALVKLEKSVRFIKWSHELDSCVLINLEERNYLGKWNGPDVNGADLALYYPEKDGTIVVVPDKMSHNILIVPEVTHITFQNSAPTLSIINWCRQFGVQSNFIFYDAIPLLRAEFLDAAPVHKMYMQQLRLADAVWPISRWSANDVVALWQHSELATRKTMPRVIPLHLPGAFDRSRSSGTGQEVQNILSVGTIEPRKNQVALIRAFKALLSERPECGWSLTLVGNLHPLVAAEVRQAEREYPEITYLGHVPDEELSHLYENCAFTVFPSVEEGFGLPILESLWHGKPCLCANFGAMIEVAQGGGCVTVDMRDDEQLLGGLKRLVDDGALRKVLTNEAHNRKMGSWEEYTNELIAPEYASRPIIYYWVDSTVTFPGNTGIQRVVRQLARALIELGFALIPVKWGGVERPFMPVQDADLDFFSQWNGPRRDQWHAWLDPAGQAVSGCFLMVELPLNLLPTEQNILKQFSHAHGLTTGIVFHDTIPWKLRDIYPQNFSQAHRAYMIEVAGYDHVLPVSRYSGDELIGELTHILPAPPASFPNIRPCVLPGEFPEARGAPIQQKRRSAEPLSILCVGTVEPRKNHQRLLDAFDLALARTSTPMRLTLVGGGHSIDPDLAPRIRSRIAGRSDVVWEEGVDDQRVKILYESCDFSIFPSAEEGFGLPIVESLCYGKPVICANFGSMWEIASDGGGCLGVNVLDVEALADGICRLVDDEARLNELRLEASSRKFRTWRDYASEVANVLGIWDYPTPASSQERAAAMGIGVRPRLSICISTYNRAGWLDTSLKNWIRLYPIPLPGVEMVICDNASTDDTQDIAAQFSNRSDVKYVRNRQNVGMLGNLRETANAANGEYIWILGDDDLIAPGSIERILKALDENKDTALVYLNYAYTRIEDSRTVTDFDGFFADGIPIVPPEADRTGPIKEICARNENFFTGIYALVLRRDHAIGAYSQNTTGRPFSTMLTCIPTTYYVLNKMMEEHGVWLGEPMLVVNMNVSWMRYAPLWILERIPEVYELAEQRGVSRDAMDSWRRHTLPGVAHFFREIFTNDPLDNASFFDPQRLVARFGHLPEFQGFLPEMLAVYRSAHLGGHPSAARPPEFVFGELIHTVSNEV